MARLLLHIGTHKTGTSSLQDLLAALSDRLREHGIMYPASGRRGTGHHDLVWSIWPKRPVEDSDCWEKLLDEVDGGQPDQIIISSEEFEGCGPEHIARIRDCLDGHEVHVVVYLRNQRDFMVSNFKQNIKGTMRYRGSFRDFVQDYIDRCDYEGLVARWTAAFGEGRVHFRCFDKVKRHPGLERDFLGLVFGEGDPRSDELAVPARSNVSPSDDCTRLLWLLNSIEQLLPIDRFKRRFVGRVRGKLLRFDAPEGNSSILRAAARVTTPPLFTPDEIEFLRERVREFNQRFFPLLNDPADRKLFEF